VQVRILPGPIAIGSGLLAPLVAHTLDSSKIYDAFDKESGCQSISAPRLSKVSTIDISRFKKGFRYEWWQPSRR
jgi:hypothetical protein